MSFVTQSKLSSYGNIKDQKHTDPKSRELSSFLGKKNRILKMQFVLKPYDKTKIFRFQTMTIYNLNEMVMKEEK